METETQTKEIEKLCQRCKRSYRDSSNDAFSCRFHPSFFVCRRHDDQKRLRISSFSYFESLASRRKLQNRSGYGLCTLES
ncbi:unnamed protein product [Thlaspi arvense]|uniref:Uncharacterized protein n=1 Tax=Thlaspi arvense TaxID=13288 RepID=A0AAU9SJZ5_THLAR|nr:unnamed protein product [Thlaspi arvense]